ncbi:iron permease [Actinoplanes sp. TBRC 11911]|uniref:iron uptake transporter permease EfeU n=1 Tax=Actinoplanes sp. TBRC 11911 TaxID=2729386 RepID=UPI00145CF26C|nr:iron uptake transporter permease EfeU [Actinoplanes sp. TBRC 11911]NMO54564.1 iron permease [Actinoplanes sp. TBRC 11911]
MLATLVIGLREGLEAALIVGIIAAFLRKNGKSLRPMWAGVLLAVALSIAVGVGLDLVERSLPQRDQEAMESVIGAVAIFFVTTMIVWMNKHARGMKRELEAEAAEALGQGSAYALAVMAFLAVLKEGFETSVFLLATFEAAQSATLAATGAVIGVLVAIGIGWGIYAGGVKINLSRFFRFTGAFLILVAAGLTITTLRTAHEAGWLSAGQQSTVNLSWLVAPGTVQSALITGVLGIPADPRLIEVLGWFAYLIPVAAFVYWPRAYRPQGRAAVRLQLGMSAAFAVVAIVLAIAVPGGRPDAPGEVAALVPDAAAAAAPDAGTLRLSAGGSTLLVSATGSPTQSLALPPAQARADLHDGIDSSTWTVDATATAVPAPSTISIAQLTALAGGHLPVGLNPQQHPGPFTARWSTHRSITVWVADGMLLDGIQQTASVLTISGSGLQTARTLSAAAARPATWQVSTAYRDSVLTSIQHATTEHSLWGVDVPIALGVAAVFLAAVAGRRLSA